MSTDGPNLKPNLSILSDMGADPRTSDHGHASVPGAQPQPQPQDQDQDLAQAHPKAQAGSGEILPSYAVALTGDQTPDHAGLGPHSEWVLTDAQGGMAMGSVLGLPMRRYHGLLCPALWPPVRRTMMLSAVAEHLHIPADGPDRPGHEAYLTPFQFAGDNHPPTHCPGLAGFSKGVDACRWVYAIKAPGREGQITITRTLRLAQRRAACRIDYQIESTLTSDDGQARVTLHLRPLLAMRDFHALNHAGTLDTAAFTSAALTEPGIQGVRVLREGLDAPLNLRSRGLSRRTEHTIWRGLRYHHETLREQSDLEDLYCPCVFTAVIEPGSSIRLRLGAAVGAGDDPIDWPQSGASKRMRVRTSIDHALSRAGDPPEPRLREAIARLASAGDDFVADRLLSGTTSKTHEHPVSTSIIAGYPWFSDWGRDAMIALPGLLLTTGRFEEARGCLRTFASARQHGLIPNRFDDDAGPAHFNTADASLWFIHACAQWSRAAGRRLDPDLIGACDDILHAYQRGTINRIALDEQDGLIRAGDEHTQLTWMDALRAGVAFTPRHGKPIEINALWINALTQRPSMGRIDDARRQRLLAMAERARASIVRGMTQGPGGALVDCLIPTEGDGSPAWRPSPELRPNQVFAVSLPGVGLSPHLGRLAMGVVTRALLTPVGLRTLDAGEEPYQPHYTGSMTDRDRAYHNGTVWPWLLGPYCEALMRINGFNELSRSSARQLMLGLTERLNCDSVGQLFEIYDAEPDSTGRRAPHGCPAQAWSVAEALRVLVMTGADPASAAATLG